MTSDEKFEAWWATQNIKMTNHVLTLAWEEVARAAWNAHADRFAALTPEVLEVAITACRLVSEEEALVFDDEASKRYAAARAALESIKENQP